ncbi:phosphonate ABC transporter, permease protein PhnE [Rhodopseudomonas palustris]|uniref:phosphonate ABC transporter, permease protein PhnE n=1 Tax=Rhodopseudomonas palustris TaxID=1076 RepID=UPI002ACDEF6E|nr:phosphonate ABC transporter, permease protein PhnE [Rhodopseudomonas palustris]WQH01583.1 phosphonate ABC transporter, permease protein PhnE [Rhodopseudomonas palustris]
MDAQARSAAPVWHPPRLIENRWLRIGIAAAVVGYLWLALSSVDVDWTRVVEGMARAARLFAGFLQPDFTSRWSDIQQGLIESLTMTVCATVFGVILALPIGLGAARNLAPWWLYGICRAVIALARSFQEIIVAILFVAMFGFGTFAGFLTLSLSTIGFLSKLIADDIEEIDPAQVEAIRATGGGFWQVIDFAVASQVTPRLVGLTAYQVDINFRESSVIGIVGAGGIGATLNTALDRYEFDSAAAILLIIIGIVMLCEYASGWIRKRVA